MAASASAEPTVGGAGFAFRTEVWPGWVRRHQPIPSWPPGFVGLVGRICFVDGASLVRNRTIAFPGAAFEVPRNCVTLRRYTSCI